MVTVPLAVHEAHEEQGHACAICQTAIAPGEAVGRCPSCEAPFHGECWEENGGCASYGCPQVPSAPKTEGPGEGSSYWGQEDKECPGCRQRIRLAALRCRHCGQTFESRAPAAPGAPAAPPAAKPSGAIAVWLFVLGLVPFTAPLVLVAGGLGLWIARARVRRWPSTRRAMAVVSIVAAAVVSLVVALVVVLHDPGAPSAVPAPAAPGAEQAQGAGDDDDEAVDDGSEGEEAADEGALDDADDEQAGSAHEEPR